MTTPQTSIRLQTTSDYPALATLHEEAFGPGRFTRTAYRIREEADIEPRLNLCAVQSGELIGAVQFTPITIGDAEGALLLGPLVISEPHKNQGHGLKLMLEGLSKAAELGYRLVILVGDLPYYARAGFQPVQPGWIALPGPVDPARLLYAELEAGAILDFKGMARGAKRLAMKGRRSRSVTALRDTMLAK